MIREPASQASPNFVADRVVHATRPVFNAIAQVAFADQATTVGPETYHQQLRTLLDRLRADLTQGGTAPHDVNDVLYAMVALADEQMLMRGGSLRDYWLPRLLQLQLFNENVAGENFFHRLGQLIGAPGRESVLKIYYLCLLFGFQGRYRVRGGGTEIEALCDQVQASLLRAGAMLPEIVLSPSGKRPYEAIADARRNLLVMWVAGEGAAAAAIWYVWLRLDVAAEASALVERISALSGG